MENDIRDEFDPPMTPHRRRAASQRTNKARFAEQRAAWIAANPKVGKWTIRGIGPKQGKHTTVICECACGRVQDVPIMTLKHGRSKQCKQCHIDSLRGARK